MIRSPSTVNTPVFYRRLLGNQITLAILPDDRFRIAMLIPNGLLHCAGRLVVEVDVQNAEHVIELQVGLIAIAIDKQKHALHAGGAGPPNRNPWFRAGLLHVRMASDPLFQSTLMSSGLVPPQASPSKSVPVNCAPAKSCTRCTGRPVGGRNDPGGWPYILKKM